MSESSKKQNFLHGAALLALSTAIVKVIGAIYKIPLRAVIGDVGYSYFTTAYDIYTLLMMITTAGLPVAMSRMVSQAYSLGQYNRVRQVYRTSRAIYLSLGALCTVLMMVGCNWLAEAMGQPGAWMSILCLAPCGVLMGFLSTYRGFFQGQGNMGPTSSSQVIEAVCKLFVGLGVAFALQKLTGEVSLAAGGAILGVTFSCLVSAIYLRGKFAPAYEEMAVSAEQVAGFRRTSRELLSIAVPITIGSAGLQLLSLLEIGLYMDQITGLLETDRYNSALIPVLEAEITAAPDFQPKELYPTMAASLKGIYNFAQTIFNMPCSFIIPINTSVLPAVTAYLTRGEDEALRSTEESAARITGLLALPCAIGLMVLGGPVMGLLGGYTGEKLELATLLMGILDISIFPYAAVMYTNVLLQAHGHAHIPVINTLVCGAVKLVGVYLLTGNPDVGIVGAPLCAFLSYIAISVLNLIAISQRLPQKPRLLRNLLRPVLPAAVMGAAVYGVLYVLQNVLSVSSRIILCGLPLIVGVGVYAVGVLLCKTITRADCLLLPKGEKIAKLLKL